MGASEVLGTLNAGASALLGYSYQAEVIAAALMVASVLPRREGFARRMALGTGLYVVLFFPLIAAVYSASASDATSLLVPALTLVEAVVLMLATVPVIRRSFVATLWQALFCATAGWTCQNLASGIEGTVSLLAERTLGTDLSISGGDSTGPAAHLTLLVVIFGATYVMCYQLFVRRIKRRGLGEVEDRRMIGVLVLVIVAVIMFDMANKELDAQGATLEVLLVLRFVHAAVCAFVLFMEYEMLYGKALEARMALESHMAAERERQWQLSQENRDAINLKCHDIRHQIRLLADGAGAHVDQTFLADLAREVDVYDSLMETGNQALDTILSEKALVCEREAIELSCIADGSALDLMTPPEIYALFGNALDNAMRATREVDDPDRRSISVVVRRVGALVSIHVENYFTGERRFSADGLPVTTQEGAGHGYGTRSMRQIVGRHGGTLALGTRGDVFTLDAMIPAAPSTPGPTPRRPPAPAR